MLRTIAIALIGVALSGCTSSTETQTRSRSAALGTQSIVMIPTLGGTQNGARAVNGRSEIAGWSETASGEIHAFFGTASTVQDLGTLGGIASHAEGLSSAGHVVGWSLTASGENHAFLWQEGLGMLDLGTLGGTESSAHDVNSWGVVVGHSRTSTGATHAFAWQPASGMHDLGTLGGTNSEAWGVNDAGQIVGRSQVSDGSWRAFVWEEGTMQAVPGTGLQVPTVAADTSHWGVVGETQYLGATTPDGGVPDGTPVDAGPPQQSGGGVARGFVRPAGGAVTVLNTLGGATSTALAVNDFGEVVGNSLTATGDTRGFVWDGSTMAPLDMSAIGGDKCSAVDINNLGEVVGSCAVSGAQRAYVLTLRPPIVVNTADDHDDGSCSGDCSLREAITLANNTPGRDAIHFNIPGVGPHHITPAWDLPASTGPVLIDGTSQPGYGSSPLVELNGGQPQPGAIDAGIPGPYHGLRVGSSHAVIRGLAIISFPGAGVYAQGESLILQACFLGVDTSGTTAAGNGRGVSLGGKRSLVGGWSPAQRNVIAGNMTGVILPVDAWPATIVGNHIGVDVAGSPLGNTGDGIYIGDRAQYGTRIIGNVIAHNLRDGVHHVMNIPPDGDDSVFWKHGTLILSNRIFENLGKGIVGAWGGPPLLDAATSATDTVEARVAGAGKEILVQLFANTSCDPSGEGEGEFPIGQATVATAASGWTTVSIPVLPGLLVPGQFITATETDRSIPRTTGFSDCIPVDGAPTPPGSSILVTPTDGATQTTPVAVTFAEVTESGFTSVTSSSSCAAPDGFKLGDPPVCYDVSTTAETAGDALVCVSYQEGQFVDEDKLELFHLEQDPATGQQSWVARTVSRDSAANVVCAEVSSFSPFVVAEVADSVGPAVTTASLSPNPAPTGTGVALSATIDDSASGASRVSSGAYSLSGGSSVAMSAADGLFDQPTELATASLGPFSDAGVHELCVSGTDAHGNTGAESCMPLVIYDPSAGFVTGGGWIESPAGAYKPDPALSGKATFGFVSRYKKGATAPSGDAQFTFTAASLAFQSTGFEWLVVAGAKAQLKGQGTVGGAGSYGFLLTAVDGQLPGGGGDDAFRVKIWDKATDTVLYDNKTGTADTTALGGGSIVIHAP